jgi:hypothetical protein
MNCETCQDLIHDLIDGSITQRDESTLNTHLRECLDCDSVRQDLAAIVGFCRTQRGVYEAPPNEQALWLRIRNTIEADLPSRINTNTERGPSFLSRWLGRSWELSLPQLAASAVAIVLLVSLATVVGLRRWGGYGAPVTQVEASNLTQRFSERQQAIDYWNQRVDQMKARWSPDMRAAFERNMKAIDESVTNSMNEFQRNPQDEFSEKMVNESLDAKLAMLKDFSDL